MSDKPIIFSAPMVRALLAGTKTQTRRLIKPQPPGEATSAGVIARSGEGQTDEWTWLSGDPQDVDTWMAAGDFKTRFRPGDRLWVKETWQAGSADGGPTVGYRADFHRWQPPFTGEDFGAGPSFDYEAFPTTSWGKGFWLADVETHGPWASPLHMPRWASRLTLHVNDVRVQRLQDIGPEDAKAEGCDAIDLSESRYLSNAHRIDMAGIKSFTLGYSELWNDINGEGSWQANHWVVALTFTVERANIDDARQAA